MPRWLPGLTVAYLALPVVIFLAGWLRWEWALPTVLCTLGAVCPLIWPCSEPHSKGRPWPWWQVGFILAGVSFVVSTQGAGGVGVQSWDWIKHNAILLDLVERPWPVVYDHLKQPVALIYYVAYYLPASLIGKGCGWQAANIALFVWTIAGCFLAGLWLWALSGGRWWLVLACLLFFSGWDLIGDVVRNPQQWWDNFDAEWWSGTWSLPSNLTLIAYAPHQAIPGWLFTALLVFLLERDGKVPPLGGIMALSLLWSPFVTIGLGLLYLLWNGASWSRWREAFCGQWHLANLAAVLLLLVMVLYFLSRTLTVGFPPSLTPDPHVVALGEFYVVPLRMGFVGFLQAYVRSSVLEFGLLVALLLMLIPRQGALDRRWVGGALITLLLLPCVHYGHYNDLVMRVCIPALFVLQIVTLRVFSAQCPLLVTSGRWGWRPALLVILVVGAMYPANMLRITEKRLANRSWQWVHLPPPEQVPDLFKQQRQLRETHSFIGQYVGSVRAPFFSHLAKPVPPRKGTPPEVTPLHP